MENSSMRILTIMIGDTKSYREEQFLYNLYYLIREVVKEQVKEELKDLGEDLKIEIQTTLNGKNVNSNSFNNEIKKMIIEMLNRSGNS